MSHVSSRGEALTTSEIAMVESLTALAISGPGQFIRKTGATTFENATPAGGGGGTVVTVTGLNTNNTDPTNPIVRISVDGSTITGAGTPASPLVAHSSAGAVITATDSGDHKNFTLSSTPTTTQYLALVNNAIYSADDTVHAFSVSGTTLTFSVALSAALAAKQIKLICV